jgi:hypothetical protein
VSFVALRTSDLQKSIQVLLEHHQTPLQAADIGSG